jgi:hypothetical protein
MSILLQRSPNFLSGSYRESSPAELGRFREEIAREGKLENTV